MDLPESAAETLKDITCGLVTHRHVDHLDPAGIQLLAERKLPVYCPGWDESHLQEKGLAAIAVSLNQPCDFLGGKITAFEAQHG